MNIVIRRSIFIHRQLFSLSRLKLIFVFFMNISAGQHFILPPFSQLISRKLCHFQLSIFSISIIFVEKEKKRILRNDGKEKTKGKELGISISFSSRISAEIIFKGFFTLEKIAVARESTAEFLRWLISSQSGISGVAAGLEIP